MWEYYHDSETDETVVVWDGTEQGRADGQPSKRVDGYLTEPDIRPVIKSTIQQSGTPTRIEMITDLIIYGLSEQV